MRQPNAWNRRVCRDCLQEFGLSVEEVRYYTSGNRFLPVRCQSCRRARREREEGKRPPRVTLYRDWATPDE